MIAENDVTQTKPDSPLPETETPRDAASKERLRMWLRMLKSTRRVEAALRGRLRREFGSTLPRFDVLAALHAQPEGMKMSELSQHLIVSNGNVTGVVDRLVADGLAERQSLATDRRAIVVRITETGRALMDDMAAAHMTWINDMFGSVSEADAARGMSIMLDIRHGTQTSDEKQSATG